MAGAERPAPETRARAATGASIRGSPSACRSTAPEEIRDAHKSAENFGVRLPMSSRRVPAIRPLASRLLNLRTATRPSRSATSARTLSNALRATTSRFIPIVIFPLTKPRMPSSSSSSGNKTGAPPGFRVAVPPDAPLFAGSGLPSPRPVAAAIWSRSSNSASTLPEISGRGPERSAAPEARNPLRPTVSATATG